MTVSATYCCRSNNTDPAKNAMRASIGVVSSFSGADASLALTDFSTEKSFNRAA
jgi:hypothetical protein